MAPHEGAEFSGTGCIGDREPAHEPHSGAKSHSPVVYDGKSVCFDLVPRGVDGRDVRSAHDAIVSSGEGAPNQVG
jgi:hypothetical protein